MRYNTSQPPPCPYSACSLVTSADQVQFSFPEQSNNFLEQISPAISIKILEFKSSIEFAKAEQCRIDGFHPLVTILNTQVPDEIRKLSRARRLKSRGVDALTRRAAGLRTLDSDS
jgi:hypothetical protein